MAIFIVENSGKVSYGIKRYICKTMEDIPVEVNGEEIAPGSKIYVSDEKKTYMLNTAGQWVEITEGGGGGGASAVSELTDVDLTNLADGQVLKYDEDTQTWKPGDDASATSLGNLEDVNLTNLQDGQVIKYDSTTEKWLASDIPSDIEEVTQAQYDALPSETKNLPIIYQISDKGYFYYKGKQFRSSRELTQAEFDALPTSVKNNGTEYLITDATTSIGDIDDVSISNATEGQILAYDETSGKWENINFIDDSHVKQNATWSSYKTNQRVIELGSSLSDRLPQRLHGILRAGQDNLGIVDTDFFEDNKAYWVSTNKFGVMPTDVQVSVSGQQIYMEFEPQDTDTEVEVIKI